MGSLWEYFFSVNFSAIFYHNYIWTYAYIYNLFGIRVSKKCMYMIGHISNLCLV